jgi:hypothetical protein
MKSISLILKVLIIMGIASANSSSLGKDDSQKKLNSILQRPLIIGASVSGDYLTESPGKRLALRYTKSDQIKVIAKKGTPGRELLKLVSATQVKNATSIIGIDLFFWDSFSSDPADSLKAMDHLVALAEQQKIPLILGDVPTLMPSRQTSVVSINKKLKDVCGHYPRCKILPLDSILKKTLAEGFITQGGMKYSLENLLPDGLHISQAASEYLADQIQKLF